jgi:hypothetical protein
MSDAARRRGEDETAPQFDGVAGAHDGERGRSETRAELSPADLPDPAALPELRIYSRSSVFFWWPVWAAGYILAAITAIWGEKIKLSNGSEILCTPTRGWGSASSSS